MIKEETKKQCELSEEEVEKQYKKAMEQIEAARKVEGKPSVVLDMLHPKVAFLVSLKGFSMRTLIRKVRSKSYTEVSLRDIEEGKKGKIEVVEEVA